MDATLVWDNTLGMADLALVNGDLQTGSDLANAMLISVFTDRQANADDVIPDGTTDRRGWWGDRYGAYPIGSRIWLLPRIVTPDTLVTAQDMLIEATAWMVDAGVAAKIEVVTQWAPKDGGDTMLAATVTAIRSDGTRVAANFGWAWLPAASVGIVAPPTNTAAFGGFIFGVSGFGNA